MPNMAAVIKLHNSNVTNPPKTDETKLAENCNCRNKSNCPLNGNCLKSCIVYKATISSGNKRDDYYESCSTLLSKNASTTTAFRFDISAQRKAPNYQNEFGSTNTKATITKSNGASLKKLLHIAVVQKYAAFVWQKWCKLSKRNQKYC